MRRRCDSSRNPQQNAGAPNEVRRLTVPRVKLPIASTVGVAGVVVVGRSSYYSVDKIQVDRRKAY